MATWSPTSTTSYQMYWTVTLGNPFTTAYYQNIVWSTASYASGSSSVGNVVYAVYPSDFGNTAGTTISGNTSTTGDKSSYGTTFSQGATYTWYAYAKALDNLYYLVDTGGKSFTMGYVGTPSLTGWAVTSNALVMQASWSGGSYNSTYDFDRDWVSGAPDITGVSGSPYNFSVPNYATQYGIRVRGVDPMGNVSGWTGFAYATSGSQPPPSIPSAISLDTTLGKNGRSANGTSSAGLYLKWTGASGSPTSYEISYKPSFSSTWSTINTNSTGTSYSLTGLSFYTTYDLKLRAYNSGGYSGYSDLSQATTSPKDVTLSVTANTNSYIEVTASGLDSGALIDYYEYDNGTVTQQITGQSALTVRFNNSAGVTRQYKAWTYVTVNSTRIDSVNGSNQVTGSTSNRPSNWAWTTAIDGSGNKVSGATYSMTAVEWRAFIQKINDFYVYRNGTGFSWNDNGTTNVGDAFTASRFNEARNVINSMNSSGIVGTMATKDAIYASYLNNLKDVLNAIA